MANGIIPVQWGKELRPSAVNSLDKINEVIHFINQSEIHEFAFSESGSGESVETANSTQLMDLTVYGKSVQNGTPTPENPVEVQVVNGKNLWHNAQRKWVNQDSSVTDQSTSLVVILPVNAGDSYTLSLENAMTSTNVGCIAFYSGEPTVETKLTRKVKTTGNSLTDTAPSNAVYMVTGVYRASEAGNIQLEAGTQATPYTPYGYIVLQIGETVTPIDLQGHTLANLPDGMQDVLYINSVGSKWIEQETGTYTITGDETVLGFTVLSDVARGYLRIPGDKPRANQGRLGSGYCSKAPYIYAFNESTTHAYVNPYGFGMDIFLFAPASNASELLEAYTGATFVYGLATPQTIELGTIEPPAIPDGSVIQILASLTPVIDVKWFTEDTLPEMMNSIIGLIKSLHPDDFQANTLNADIVHSLNPIDINPISDIRPISDIKQIEDNESEE